MAFYGDCHFLNECTDAAWSIWNLFGNNNPEPFHRINPFIPLQQWKKQIFYEK